MSRKLLVEVLVLCIFFTLQITNVEAPFWSKKSSPAFTTEDEKALKKAVEILCDTWDKYVRSGRNTQKELSSKGAFQGCVNYAIDQLFQSAKDAITTCAETAAEDFSNEYKKHNLNKETRDHLHKTVNTCIGKFETYNIDVPELQKLLNQL